MSYERSVPRSKRCGMESVMDMAFYAYLYYYTHEKADRGFHPNWVKMPKQVFPPDLDSIGDLHLYEVEADKVYLIDVVEHSGLKSWSWTSLDRHFRRRAEDKINDIDLPRQERRFGLSRRTLVKCAHAREVPSRYTFAVLDLLTTFYFRRQDADHNLPWYYHNIWDCLVEYGAYKPHDSDYDKGVLDEV